MNWHSIAAAWLTRHRPPIVYYPVRVERHSQWFSAKGWDAPNWRNDAETSARIFHDPTDQRFDTAIQAFKERGYRLKEEFASVPRGSWLDLLTPTAQGEVPMITLVFVIARPGPAAYDNLEPPARQNR